MPRRRWNWLRLRRWRAFFRVAGVFPWLFAAGVFATGALFAETHDRRAEQAAREAAAKAVEAQTPVPALTLETLREHRSEALALAGLWLPRALWTGFGMTSVVAVGVIAGLVFRGGGRTADPAPRRRRAERPARSAKAVRERNVGEETEDEKPPPAVVPMPKPKKPKPNAADPTPTFAPPKPGALPPIPLAFDEYEAPPPPARKPAAPAPPKPAKPVPAPVSKRPQAPAPELSDDDRLEAMY